MIPPPEASPDTGPNRSGFPALIRITLLALLAAGGTIHGTAQPPESVTRWRGLAFPGSRNAPEASAQAFLRANAAGLGLNADTSDLELVEVKHGLASSHTRFRRTIDGVPVFGAYVTVSQGPRGDIQGVHSSYLPALNRSGATPAAGPSASGLRPVPAIASASSADSARATLGIRRTYLEDSAELIWYPVGDARAVLAWKCVTYSAEPLGDWLTIADATTGEILLKTDIMARASGPSGLVYLPNPWQTQGSGANMVDANDVTNPALDAQRVSVPLQGLNLTQNKLAGEFANVSAFNSPHLPDVDASEPTHIYEYDRDDPRFEQVVVYHTIDSIQRYIHALGFDDDVGMPNGIRDFPTYACAHWDGADQSFYSTGNGRLHFGDGGVDDAEDADIIAHEYGHAIQNDQNATWFGGHMGAMGEGFGDYLAASFHADSGDPAYQALHAACVAEWDASAYSVSSPPCLRRVDGAKLFPDDMTGSVHNDGEIWSRALWDLRAAIGGFATDQLVLEHHFGLPFMATMPIAACDIIQADVNINGGIHIQAIRQAFIDRGILNPGSCNPSAGWVEFDAQVYGAPDSVQVTLTDADLDGMPAYDVLLTVVSGDSETVTLTAQGAGVFQATVPTIAGPPAANGTLDVTHGDVISVTYTDAADGYGGMNVPLTDTAEVFILCPADVTENFDGTVTGWTHGAAGGANDRWDVRASAQAASAPNVYSYEPGTGVVADAWLESPDLYDGRVLTFRHSHDIENIYDGAVIEISEDGGPWTDLGPAFILGGYNSSVSIDFGSPLAGRAAWGGVSDGMERVWVDLSAWSPPFRIRFRFASDTSVPSAYWRIDDFELSDSFPCGPDPTSTPTPAPTASPTPTPPPCCPGDADNSAGAVNANDFLAVQGNFGADHGVGGLGDADCSGGAVNANDFLSVQGNFGTNCG